MTGLELRERTDEYMHTEILNTNKGRLEDMTFQLAKRMALHGPPVEFLIEALERAQKSMRSAGMYEADYVLDDLRAIREARGDVTDNR